MKELFRERDYTRVGYYQSVLEEAGIPTHVRNKDLVGIMTEVPIPDFFPALCVVHDEDHAHALQILKDRVAVDEAKPKEEWKCASCEADNPGNFEVCWSCEGEGLGTDNSRGESGP